MSLRMDKVSFEYNEKSQVFRDLDLHIESGTASAIYGESGSGKSTLFKLLIGRLVPSAGKIQWIRRDNEISGSEGRNIGLVYQKNEFIDELTMEENLLIQFAYSDSVDDLEELRSRIDSYTNELLISHLLDKYPPSLSIGEKRRFMVVKALIYHPEVIILDEPTASLDYHNRVKIIELLSRTSWHPTPTIIVFTHDILFLHYHENYGFYKIVNKRLEGVHRENLGQ